MGFWVALEDLFPTTRQEADRAFDQFIVKRKIGESYAGLPKEVKVKDNLSQSLEARRSHGSSWGG